MPKVLLRQRGVILSLVGTCLGSTVFLRERWLVGLVRGDRGVGHGGNTPGCGLLCGTGVVLRFIWIVVLWAASASGARSVELFGHVARDAAGARRGVLMGVSITRVGGVAAFALPNAQLSGGKRQGWGCGQGGLCNFRAYWAARTSEWAWRRRVRDNSGRGHGGFKDVDWHWYQWVRGCGYGCEGSVNWGRQGRGQRGGHWGRIDRGQDEVKFDGVDWCWCRRGLSHGRGGVIDPGGAERVEKLVPYRLVYPFGGASSVNGALPGGGHRILVDENEREFYSQVWSGYQGVASVCSFELSEFVDELLGLHGVSEEWHWDRPIVVVQLHCTGLVWVSEFDGLAADRRTGYESGCQDVCSATRGRLGSVCLTTLREVVCVGLLRSSSRRCARWFCWVLSEVPATCRAACLSSASWCYARWSVSRVNVPATHRAVSVRLPRGAARGGSGWGLSVSSMYLLHAGLVCVVDVPATHRAHDRWFWSSGVWTAMRWGWHPRWRDYTPAGRKMVLVLCYDHPDRSTR
ncbi:hypothetical protein EDB86DRAFT_2829607 [Lactarius hatsudake]|nr:hypothetical protein EDB86DRAFT_2829607 [Lactarius hatsudake]